MAIQALLAKTHLLAHSTSKVVICNGLYPFAQENPQTVSHLYNPYKRGLDQADRREFLTGYLSSLMDMML
jgi:hypothetical protein